MRWLQIKIPADPDQAELLEDALLDCGALAVTFEDSQDQPILEPALGEMPLWDRTLLTGLFDASVDTTAVHLRLVSQFAGLKPRWEQVEDRDWEREWIKNYQPIQCGRLAICPSWQLPEHTGDKVNLLLDPGLAFGTGTHPTTFLCLQWLEQENLRGATLLDYGCGSGILAIAGLLLGAERAWCVDIDPQALAATRENAQRNGIDPDRIQTYLPSELPEVKADIVLANILAGPLVELAQKLSELTISAGRLCLSGVLENQADTLKNRYKAWFDVTPPVMLEGWVRLAAIKR